MQMSIASPLGLAFGSLIPPLVVGNNDLHKIDRYLQAQAALGLMVIAFMLCMRSHPPTAPSSTAAYRVRHHMSVQCVATKLLVSWLTASLHGRAQRLSSIDMPAVQHCPANTIYAARCRVWR